MSVAEAAASLGVSSARVRQRIDDGSLVAEKVGGRWLVDLSVVPGSKSRGRPVKPELVWDAIRQVDAVKELRRGPRRQFEDALRLLYSAQPSGFQGPSRRSPDLLLSDGSVVEIKVGYSSRRRALNRLLEVVHAVGSERQDAVAEEFLRWLGDRADRRIYRVAPRDFEDLREDVRLLRSGLSHPRSGMQDPRVIEGYVAAAELEAIIDDHWLEAPGVDAAPNVFLHVAPGCPDEVSPLMLAADLFEHRGSRERARAHELVAEAFA